MSDINNNKFEEMIESVKKIFIYKSEDDTKNRIREILHGLPLSGWSYTLNGDLVMIHIDNDKIRNVGVRNYNGAIIDIVTEAIVCYGKYIPSVVTDSISSHIQNGILTLTDTECNVHILPMNQTVIQKGVNGVCVRAFWYNNTLYLATYKNFMATGRWNGACFLEAYNQANGPQAEDLFDTDHAYSSTVYLFNIHHHAWCVGSRQDVEVSSITLLDVIDMIPGYPEDTVPGLGKFKVIDKILPVLDKTFDEPTVYGSPFISVEDADLFLEHGFYLNDKHMFDDNRNKHGEAVLITHNGFTIMLKSEAFAWREKIRGGNPNILFAFNALLKLVQQVKDFEALKEHFIMFPAWPERCFRDLFEHRDNQLTCFPTNESAKSELFDSEGVDTPLDCNNLDALYRLVWMNYVLSIPFCYQEEAMDYLNTINQTKITVCNWLDTMHKRFYDVRGVGKLSEHINEERNKVIFKNSHRRILAIIDLVRERKFKEYNRCIRNGMLFDEENFIKENIKDVVNREFCDSLHRIAKAIKFYNQDPLN